MDLFAMGFDALVMFQPNRERTVRLEQCRKAEQEAR